MADLKGRLIGGDRLIKAINFMPKEFIGNLAVWLQNERGRFLGGKGARGKHFKGGFTNSLAKKKRKKRDGAWSKRVTRLFKGNIPFARRVNDLSLTMGIIGKKHQLKRAMEFLSTGGTISSSREMPVPHYKNLAAIGFKGPFSEGSVNTGLRSKAFRKFADSGKLVGLRIGGNTFYFNKEGKRNKRGRFSRKDLLFMGLHGVTVRKTLIGRFDLENQFNKKQGKMIERGQRAIDRATKKVERKFGV